MVVFEAALFPKEIWNILIGRLRDPKGPLKGLVTTTPKGFNWLYYYFVRKIDPETKKPLQNANSYEWFSGTTLDNPYLPQEYKDTLLSQYNGKFKKQEIFGEFIGFEGMVYDTFKNDVNIIKEEDIPKEFKDYSIGLDWGFTNPMACVIIGYDGDNRAYVIEEYYRPRETIENVSEWLNIQYQKYKGLEQKEIFGDPSEPQNIFKLNSLGHNCQKANNNVMNGIAAVYELFELKEDQKSALYISEKCQNLIEEINHYRYHDKKDNSVIKEEPIKIMDHLCDALRYAIYTKIKNDFKFVLLQDPNNLTGLF